MILVDFSNLFFRNLYTAVINSKAKIKDNMYVTDDFKSLLAHQILNSLRSIQKRFSTKFGNLIICYDSRGYWRREIYSRYKHRRKSARDKSKINFDEVLLFQDELKLVIDFLPYETLCVEKTEADDLIGVLAKHYSEKSLVISGDKDFIQVLKYGCLLYNPLENEFVKKNIDEVNDFMLKHTILGDAGDDIPSIMEGTEFTEKFKSFLKNQDIYTKTVNEFLDLKISNNIINQFLEQEQNDYELIIYKKPRFGIKSVEKVISNLDTILENEIIRRNYERNKKLILFDEIPDTIRNKIIEVFNEKLGTKKQVNMLEFKKYLSDNNMRQLLNDFSDFSINVKNQKNDINNLNLKSFFD